MAVTITTPTFTNRVVQYPSRYILNNVSGSTYDLVRDEGTVTVAGTPQNEITFNKIKTDLDALNTNIGEIETNGIIGDNQYGATLVTNLDTISKCGFYECNTSATGVPPSFPTNIKWLVLHQNNTITGTDIKYQRATAMAPGIPITYERTNIAGWNSWVLVPNDARITTAETDIADLKTGWNPANETWTYASVDDPTGNITISGDVTTKYSVGMRIKFTNATNIIYGIITKIAYSSPNTTLTFLHEINPLHYTDPTTYPNTALYLMANSAITNNYYSNMKVPYGFPIVSNKWSVSLTLTTYNAINNPGQNIVYNLESAYLDLPIGRWKPSLESVLFVDRATAGTCSFIMGLSESNNTQTNTICKIMVETTSVANTVVFAKNYDDSYPEVTSKKRLYLIGYTPVSGISRILQYATQIPTKINVVSTYL